MCVGVGGGLANQNYDLANSKIPTECKDIYSTFPLLNLYEYHPPPPFLKKSQESHKRNSYVCIVK